MQAIDEHVVENAAGVVGDERITDLTRLHVDDAARRQRIEERRDVGGIGRSAVETEPAHVRHVEQAGGGADGGMLGGDRRVLHGHRPAGEVDQPPAESDVTIVQRRSGERFGHRSSTYVKG